MMYRMPRFAAVLLVALAVSVALSVSAAPREEEKRPSQWASPAAVAGVPNLYRVAQGVYRSAQPTPRGFKNLEELGVKTVVNLRAFHGDRRALTGTSLRELRVKMYAWDPDEEEIIQVMRILADPGGGPYLVHCMDGADRTGVVIAVYRMVFQDWTREAAVDEMVNGGFGLHLIWGDIFRYLKQVDVEKIRRLAGLLNNRTYDL
ncbi:MAG: tyrosine-protein phosphatase [Synergistaceae bacterium]|jgi:protein tyrosine/serine phosphatase|nr:tyrosine-protein phosphatase [Synergistaceae bacterium]